MLIDQSGHNLGVVPLKEALAKAEAVGLDLVEMAQNSSPPVCKILDYGKFKYLTSKRKNEAKKKQKNIEMKEIKIRPGIEKHDYMVKLRNMQKFLNEGDKVKVTLRFRGRENAHIDIGQKLLERVKDDLCLLSKAESLPQFEGRQMMMVLAPLTAKQRKQLELEQQEKKS